MDQTGQTRKPGSPGGFLISSLTISSMGIVASVVAWWLVRLHNIEAVEAGKRTKDLVIAEAEGSSLPLLLFILVIVGGTALALAFVGAREARDRPRLLIVAGVLATTLLMVPVVVVANALVVTTGVMLND